MISFDNEYFQRLIDSLPSSRSPYKQRKQQFLDELGEVLKTLRQEDVELISMVHLLPYNMRAAFAHVLRDWVSAYNEFYDTVGDVVVVARAEEVKHKYVQVKVADYQPDKQDKKDDQDK